MTDRQTQKAKRTWRKWPAWAYGGYAAFFVALSLFCYVLLPALGWTPRVWLSQVWIHSGLLLLFFSAVAAIVWMWRRMGQSVAIVMTIAMMGVSIFTVPMGLFVFAGILDRHESLIEKEGRWVWAVASTGFHTNVSFYDPVNVFAMRRNEMKDEYYEGTYNPYQRGSTKNPYTFSGTFVSRDCHSLQDVYTKGGAALMFAEDLAPGECRGRYVIVDPQDPSRIAYLDIDGTYDGDFRSSSMDVFCTLHVQKEDAFRQPKSIVFRAQSDRWEDETLLRFYSLHRI